MKTKVTVRDIRNCFSGLTAIGSVQTTNTIALAIAQNIRVLQMEMETINARHETIIKEFPADVRVVSNSQGRQVYVPYPPGWNHDDFEKNSKDMLRRRVSINESFNKTMGEFNNAEITIVIRGLDPNTEIPGKCSANDLANCAWVFNNFEASEEKDQPVTEPEPVEAIIA